MTLSALHPAKDDGHGSCDECSLPVTHPTHTAADPPRYQHYACDRAIQEDRREDACEGCQNPREALGLPLSEPEPPEVETPPLASPDMFDGLPADADTWTVAEARDWLRERATAEGERCPVCTQLAKVYRRDINAQMAGVLIQMHHKAGQDWIHVPGLKGSGADESKCRFWGLIEAMPGERADGSKRNGWWRLTPKGTDFVLNRIAIPWKAIVYDNRCLGLDDSKTTTIVKALGKRFDYRELMDDHP